jgi:hypothetical protein
MGATGQRLLGLVVWRAGRWYLRRQPPHVRAAALAGLAGLLLLGAVAEVARRLAD